MGRVPKPPWFLTWRAVAMTALLVWWPSPAAAWKIETHVWIAQQVLNDLLPQSGTRCAVTLPVRERNADGTYTTIAREYLVDPAICESLARYPDAFRIGSLGPDAFPDLVGGQMTTHPGVPGGWATNVWLEWVVSGAARPSLGGGSESLAFGYGFLTHAAGDVFAHTYVNSYSGDIFDLEIGNSGGEQEVEFRHMKLEGYLKAHNPPLVGPTGAPMGRPEDNAQMTDALAAFIRDRLILNPDVAAQYRTQATTRHLAWMYDHWRKLGDGIQEIDALLATINGEIARLQNLVNSVQDQIDDFKDKKVCAFFGKCFRVYPASCFVEPITCATILSLEVALTATNTSLQFAIAANDAAAASVREPLQFWRNDVEEAVKQYVITSHEVAKSIMKADLNPPDGDRALAKVRNWLCRYGPVFGAIPSQLSGMACVPAQHAADLTSRISGLYDQFNGSTLAWLVNPVGAAGERIKQEIGEHVLGDLANELLDDHATLRSLADLREANVDAASLNQDFNHDGTQKSLLTFPDVASLVDADMAVTEPGQPFDPEHFHAAHDAILISKLLLLGPSELNRLARDNGVNVTIYGANLYALPAVASDGSVPPFNVLFESVRSIDGNHQWQQYALRYPRTVPTADTVAHEYGYPFVAAEARGGFRLWQDCEARERVFTRLFKGPVAPALSPLVLPLDAGWESEDLPFPFSPWSPEPPKLVFDRTLGNVLLCGGEPPAGTTWVHAPTGYVPTSPADTIPPMVVPPPDLTVECTARGTPTQHVVLGEAVAVDDRDGPRPVVNDAPAAFDVASGTTVVTWSATDSAQPVANTGTAQQRVTVADTQAPQFLDVAAHPDAQGRFLLSTTRQFTATSPEGVSTSLPSPAVEDACSGPTPAWVLVPASARELARNPAATPTLAVSPYIFPIGRTLVPWIAWDIRDRSTFSIAWEIVDVAAVRGDLNVDGQVDAADAALLLADLGTTIVPAVLRDFDNDGDIDAIDQDTLALILGGDPDPRDLDENGVIDVMDLRQLVRIWNPVDISPPEVSCPTTIVVPNAPGQGSATVTYPAAPTATDDYPGVIVSVDPASESVFSVGTHIVTATATDALGHSTNCHFIVIVNDVEPPVVTCPAAIVQENDPGAAGAVVSFAPTATDNAPGVTLSITPEPGSFIPLGQTTASATATDRAGLRASCSFTITVNDTEPPTIVPPPAVTLEATGPSGATVSDATLGVAIATDNSGSATVTRSGVPVANVFPLGRTVVRYVATDPFGNSSIGLQTVSIVDTTPPTILIGSPVEAAYTINQVVIADYSCSDMASGVASCTSHAASGRPIDTSTPGRKTFTVTATDGAGNVAATSVTYTVSYRVCLLYNTDHAAKSGATLPLKIQLCDAGGTNISSPSVPVTALQVVRVSGQTSTEVADAGEANPDSNFRFDALLGGTGGYIFNLSTRGLLAGTYVVTCSVTNDPLTHSEVTFRVR